MGWGAVETEVDGAMANNRVANRWVSKRRDQSMGDFSERTSESDVVSIACQAALPSPGGSKE